MKAIKIKKAGGPEVLELEDITLRKPVRDEVIIEHTAIGLNYIDTYHRSGLYPLIFPSGLGMEATGVIKETGPDVKGFAVGDKVAYASVPLGAYSTHRIFKTKSLVKVPDEIDLTLAATLMTKGLTTFYLLYKTYPVTSGETILFHAAAGGVGQIFCQWAKSLGCKVIGTVGSDDKISLAKENGCEIIERLHIGQPLYQQLSCWPQWRGGHCHHHNHHHHHNNYYHYHHHHHIMSNSPSLLKR